jgi:hypothetical protein
MARPRDLVPANCYFLLNYFDSDLVIPSIQTLTFVGTDKDENGETMWLFREPVATAPETDHQASEDESPLVAFSRQSLYQILELNGLIRELGGLTDFHPLSRSAKDDAHSPSRRAECPELVPVIERLLTSPPGTAVTITIEFTDDGFSLRRRQGAVEFSHFLSSKTEQDQESLVRRMFSERGCLPADDYLANGGKTRVLSFVVRDDLSDIASLANKILCEAHSMYPDDTLHSHFREVEDKSH